jgi:hypothetical protein
MLNLPTPQNEIQLIHCVSTWAKYNFPNTRAPHLGIAEEVGEAIHCSLKRFQQIRGFQNEDFFISHLTDALADCIIYLCDWCEMHSAFFSFGRNQIETQKLTMSDESKIIVHLLQASAAAIQHSQRVDDNDMVPDVAIVAIANNIAQRIANGCEYWAGVYNIDLRLAVANVWATVSKRDWQNNPTNADTV